MWESEKCNSLQIYVGKCNFYPQSRGFSSSIRSLYVFCVHIRKTTRSCEFLKKCSNDNNVLEKLQKGGREGASRSSPYRTPLLFIERKGKLISCVISALCSHTTYTQLCSMQGIKRNTIFPQSSKSFHFSFSSHFPSVSPLLPSLIVLPLHFIFPLALICWTRRWPPCPSHWRSNHLRWRALSLLYRVTSSWWMPWSSRSPWYQVLSP